MNIESKTLAEEMKFVAEDVGKLLQSLSNPHRLLIVCQVLFSEKSVGELADFLQIRTSSVSQHLALLRREGVVKARREGQTIYYSIQDQSVRRVLETLYQVYCPAKDENYQHLGKRTDNKG